MTRCKKCRDREWANRFTEYILVFVLGFGFFGAVFGMNLYSMAMLLGRDGSAAFVGLLGVIIAIGYSYSRADEEVAK